MKNKEESLFFWYALACVKRRFLSIDISIALVNWGGRHESWFHAVRDILVKQLQLHSQRGEKKKDTEQIITVYYNYKPMPSYKKYTSSTNPTKHAKPPSPVKLRSNVTQLDSSVYSPY